MVEWVATPTTPGDFSDPVIEPLSLASLALAGRIPIKVIRQRDDKDLS